MQQYDTDKKKAVLETKRLCLICFLKEKEKKMYSEVPRRGTVTDVMPSRITVCLDRESPRFFEPKTMTSVMPEYKSRI